MELRIKFGDIEYNITDKIQPIKKDWVLRNSNEGDIIQGIFSSVENAKAYAVKDFNSYSPNDEGKIIEERENHKVIYFSVVNSKRCTNYDIEDLPIDWEE